MEVDTPVLSQSAACDLNIESFAVVTTVPLSATARKMFLQTSPEFAMKRLLASGSGPIYQIAHAFRNGEAGRHHNPEFAMLEWYQPGYSLQQLMDETRDLLIECLGQSLPVLSVSYAGLFEKTLGINPHQATVLMLAEVAAENGHPDAERVCGDRKSDWLDYLFSECIQPSMRSDVLYFVNDYPVSQAMLAQIKPTQPPVAERFEVFLNGIELANGFHELIDADEQAARFSQELALRSDRGDVSLPMPEHLLSALSHGVPDSCGVALGLDRLLMISAGADHLNQVLPFPLQRA